MILKKYYLLLLLLASISVEAKINCEVLHPNLQEKDLKVDGSITAQSKGFFSKILGAEGKIEGKSITQDSLTQYNNVEELAKWYSIIYMVCTTIENDSELSTKEKLDYFSSLLKSYFEVVKKEEIINSKGNKVSAGFAQDIVNENKPMLMNLENDKIGRSPNRLGKNLIIREQRGKKYVSGRDKNGLFGIGGLNVQSGEISFSLKFHIEEGSRRDIILVDEEKNSYVVKFDNEFVQFGSTKKKFYQYKWKYWHSSFGYGPNVLKFEIEDDLIVFFINDYLIDSINKKPGLIITQAGVRGISKGDIILGFSATPTNQ